MKDSYTDKILDLILRGSIKDSCIYDEFKDIISNDKKSIDIFMKLRWKDDITDEQFRKLLNKIIESVSCKSEPETIEKLFMKHK